MSNAHKIMENAETKKVREPRAKKVKVNLAALPDAVQDGKLIVPVKGKIVFVRSFSGKDVVHQGHVWSYDEKTGDVSVWDETRQQYWGFNAAKDGPRIVCKALEPITSDAPKTP